jgi:hypothetical protein
MEILTPGLVVVKDFFPNYDEIMEKVRFLGEDPQSKARWIQAGVDNRKKDTDKVDYRNVDPIRSNDGVYLDSRFATAESKTYNAMGTIAVDAHVKLEEYIKEYMNLYILSRNIKEIPSSYNLLRYRGGQQYKLHDDFSIINRRAISFLIYLNDDYEGGNIEFPFVNVNLKPEKNSLVIFPSNYLFGHIAHPVTNGTKYALVNWIEWA